MPYYRNPNQYSINLAGPNGTAVTVSAGSTTQLPDYFDRYVPTGTLVRATNPRTKSGLPLRSGIQMREEQLRVQRLQTAKKIVAQRHTRAVQPARKVDVVGHRLRDDATQVYRSVLSRSVFPVSDGVGVGILSYNRAGSLRRLVESIRRHTDLRRTTVLISDDSSTDPATTAYLAELANGWEFTVLRNRLRLGVAGNSNRLLRCLSRFDHLLLLNDDVEVLAPGWEHLYPRAAKATGLCHMVFHQPGVYGAREPEPAQVRSRPLGLVRDRPQGAVLYCSHGGLGQIGYMDQQYGLYGMEHVDWSMKAWELAGQAQGFYDVPNSRQFFRVHAEASAVQQRHELLEAGRLRFSARHAQKLGPGVESEVPTLTYVVPLRDLGRAEAVRTVIANLRAQRFPALRIILVEQDNQARSGPGGLGPIEYLLAPAEKEPFNKGLAFNRGVAGATGRVVLHDADTMVQSGYSQAVWQQLQRAEACHLGATVIYADQESSALIARTGVVGPEVRCERVVDYFEGGSLACEVDAYWRVGGFNEDFWGYGNEDCDFYYRVSGGCKWANCRTQDFLHLWHGRTPGWQQHHEQNKRLEQRLREIPLPEYIQQLRRRNGHYTS